MDDKNNFLVNSVPKITKRNRSLENFQQFTLLFGIIGIILFIGLLLDTLLQLRDGTLYSYFLGTADESKIFKVGEDLKHFLPADQALLDSRLNFNSHSNLFNQTYYLTNDKKKTVCYYSVSFTIPNARDELPPESINSFLCTHLIIIGGVIVDKNSTIVIGEAVTKSKILQRTLKLKDENPELKIMVCIGDNFSELVKNKTAVKRFAYNARMFLEKYNLDGIDIDWEFPNFPPTIQKHHEKELFVFLTEQLSTALRLVSPRYLLSIAVSNAILIINYSYDFRRLNDNVDFVSLMGYDFHMYSPIFPFVGHNAPFLPRKSERGFFSTLNLAYSADIINKKGIDKNKLIVGIPIYGRTWSLLYPDSYGVDAPSTGVGSGRGWTNYTRAMDFIKSGGEDLWDCEAKVPFTHKGTEWISYENEHSAYLKWLQNGNFLIMVAFKKTNNTYLYKIKWK